MTVWAVARSISRSAREQLRQHRFDARVLGAFEHACDLVTPGGDVVALVTPQVGDGPLNVVLDSVAGLFAGIDPGTPATLEGEQLCIGGLGVDLRGAAVWEPRPDWEALRARRAVLLAGLPLLRTLCLRYAPAGSLLGLLGAPLPDDAPSRAIFSTAQPAAEVLGEGWAGNLARLQEGAAGLAGLGGGLTPAGDDFLAGALLWAWLAHPAPAPFCQVLAEVAIPRTTTLSAAFLRAAARGECSAAWHALLAALSEAAEAEIAAAVREVLAHGATSGADSLAGFLYLVDVPLQRGFPAPSCGRPASAGASPHLLVDVPLQRGLPRTFLWASRFSGASPHLVAVPLQPGLSRTFLWTSRFSGGFPAPYGRPASAGLPRTFWPSRFSGGFPAPYGRPASAGAFPHLMDVPLQRGLPRTLWPSRFSGGFPAPSCGRPASAGVPHTLWTSRL